MADASAKVLVWEYAREDVESLGTAAAVARDRLAEPDLEVLVVSARDDHMTVQVVRGKLDDPASIVFVEQGGAFEVVRVESWPGSRTLLVLRAWRGGE